MSSSKKNDNSASFHTITSYIKNYCGELPWIVSSFLPPSRTQTGAAARPREQEDNEKNGAYILPIVAIDI
jgi:hypothetical protein